MTIYKIRSRQYVTRMVKETKYGLVEISMKTGRELRYGMTFLDLNDLEERGFELIDIIEI